jgi:ribosomal protein L13E
MDGIVGFGLGYFLASRRDRKQEKQFEQEREHAEDLEEAERARYLASLTDVSKFSRDRKAYAKTSELVIDPENQSDLEAAFCQAVDYYNQGFERRLAPLSERETKAELEARPRVNWIEDLKRNEIALGRQFTSDELKDVIVSCRELGRDLHVDASRRENLSNALTQSFNEYRGLYHDYAATLQAQKLPLDELPEFVDLVMKRQRHRAVKSDLGPEEMQLLLDFYEEQIKVFKELTKGPDRGPSSLGSHSAPEGGPVIVDSLVVERAKILSVEVDEMSAGAINAEKVNTAEAHVDSVVVENAEVESATVDSAKIDDASVSNATIDSASVAHASMDEASIGSANVEKVVVKDVSLDGPDSGANVPPKLIIVKDFEKRPSRHSPGR